MSDTATETKIQADFREAGLHPRDVAYRTHIPFDHLMAMWRGEAGVTFDESRAISRLTGRRSDYYQTDASATP